MLNICRGRRDLAVILGGRTVSTFGDGVALVALTLRLQADGARPYQVGVLLASGTVPLLLLARPVGRLVDTHDSRTLLVAGGLAEVAATIPLVFLHSVVPMVALVAVLACAASLTGATWSALLPRVVGEDRLAEAISTLTSLNVLALVAAPAVGGLLAGAFGSGLPVAIDAGTFVVVTIAAIVVRTRRRPEPARATDGSPAVRGGLTLLRADRVLAPLLAGMAVVVLLVGMVDVITVYLVRGTLHAGGAWYGWVEASWMAGMVVGAVGAGRVRTERGQVRATIAGAGVVCVALAGFAVAPVVAALVLLSVLGGIGNGYAGTCLSTLLMLRTPDRARGRVSATTNAVFGGAQGTSLLVGGILALALSPRAIYAVAGLLGLAATGVVAATSPGSPPSSTPEPAPELDSAR